MMCLLAFTSATSPQASDYGAESRLCQLPNSVSFLPNNSITKSHNGFNIACQAIKQGHCPENNSRAGFKRKETFMSFSHCTGENSPRRSHNRYAALILALSLLAGSLIFMSCPSNVAPENLNNLTVSITPSPGGTITANPMSGSSGTWVDVFVNADPGYRLAEGSLMLNNTPITGSEPFGFTLTENVTITAEFEALPAGQFSVTIGTFSNGTITATPSFGPSGSEINLSINPAPGFVLSEGSLTFTVAGGSPVLIAGTSFILPSAHVTVNAVFERGNANMLIASGISALQDGNFDAAIRAFEAAYSLDNNNQEALLYSSLARLAAIAVDNNVRALVRDRLGIRNFPGTINALVNLDWLETYTDEWFQWSFWSEEHNSWASWFYENDTWLFGQSDLEPRSGYYVTRGWTWTLISTEWNDEIGYWGWYGNQEVQWFYENDTWFFVYSGLPPISGYYAQVLEATFVSEERRYDTWTSRLPGLDVPVWFQNTGVFENTLTSAGLKSPATFPLLMFANLIDKNTAGLNALLDALLSSVFGASFDEAARRAGALTSTVMLDESLLEALGINDIFEGEQVAIGRAELNVLFSLMRIVRGSLEWLAAYDWNTDINFLADGQLWDDWARIEDITLGPASLPLRNNFLRARNNNMMANSRNSFIRAIDDLISSYEFWISSASNLPPAFRDILGEFQWVRSGLGELRNAINTGGNFYLKDASDSSVYENTPENAFFGINLGAFFTPGHFAIDNLLSTRGSGGNMAPQFYGWQDWDSAPVPITTLAELRQQEVIGFRLNLRPVQDVVVLGFDFGEDYVELQFMPPDIAEIIWNWYH